MAIRQSRSAAPALISRPCGLFSVNGGEPPSAACRKICRVQRAEYGAKSGAKYGAWRALNPHEAGAAADYAVKAQVSARAELPINPATVKSRFRRKT
jgi:hypothetical protein